MLTNQQTKQVELALGRMAEKVMIESMKGIEHAKRFVTKFTDRNGEPFRFYAYIAPKGKKIYLTDGGMILASLQKPGLEVELNVLQRVLRSYDLIITKEGDVIEQTDRPMGQRVSALFQAWAMADGVIRTWTVPEPKEKQN